MLSDFPLSDVPLSSDRTHAAASGVVGTVFRSPVIRGASLLMLLLIAISLLAI